MRNCHKRWKKEQKEKHEALMDSFRTDKTRDMLEDLVFFMKKHPDQATYEIEQFNKACEENKNGTRSKTNQTP